MMRLMVGRVRLDALQHPRTRLVTRMVLEGFPAYAYGTSAKSEPSPPVREAQADNEHYNIELGCDNVLSFFYDTSPKLSKRH